MLDNNGDSWSDVLIDTRPVTQEELEVITARTGDPDDKYWAPISRHSWEDASDDDSYCDITLECNQLCNRYDGLRRCR